jgi:hypothetical protein
MSKRRWLIRVHLAGGDVCHVPDSCACDVAGERITVEEVEESKPPAPVKLMLHLIRGCWDVCHEPDFCPSIWSSEHRVFSEVVKEAK